MLLTTKGGGFMADAVQPGTIVNPKPDEDQINEDSDRDPLASGGGEPEEIDDVRAETGTRSGDEELNTAEDLTEDAKQD